MARVQNDVTGWVGWIYFASMMMLIVGGLDILAGIVGLFHKEFYVATQNGGWVVFNNYTAWGWINIIYGVILLLGALSVTSGKMWARIFASLLVVGNAIANLAFLPAYPLWSILGLIVNGLVLYALTVHGGELRERADY